MHAVSRSGDSCYDSGDKQRSEHSTRMQPQEARKISSRSTTSNHLEQEFVFQSKLYHDYSVTQKSATDTSHMYSVGPLYLPTYRELSLAFPPRTMPPLPGFQRSKTVSLYRDGDLTFRFYLPPRGRERVQSTLAKSGSKSRHLRSHGSSV